MGPRILATTLSRTFSSARSLVFWPFRRSDIPIKRPCCGRRGASQHPSTPRCSQGVFKGTYGKRTSTRGQSRPVGAETCALNGFLLRHCGVRGILLPLNTRFKGTEAAYFLKTSSARFLVTVEGFSGTDYPARLNGADAGPLEEIVVIDHANAMASPNIRTTSHCVSPVRVR
jgi:hypothetical protein